MTTRVLALTPARRDDTSWRATPARRSIPHHHGSHRALLVPSSPRGLRPIDAIVVPTARPVAYLRHVVDLARRASCPLLLLCSKKTSAAKAFQYWGEGSSLRLIAVDLPPTYNHPLLDFTTSASPQAQFARDTALKRNIGLLVARMAGWERIIFLDDDITVEDRSDLRRAAALLDDFDTVGLSLTGYPDNSVVCHAHRIVGGKQETFVGGGAMAVAPFKTNSFFPNVYNEDWFFLLDDPRIRPVTVTGQAMQRPYDPFASPRRAEAEEFGDVMAEGLFWLLDEHRRFKGATRAYWDSFLTRRRLFITAVVERVHEDQRLGPRERRPILDALDAAYRRASEITAESCVSYLEAWRADRRRWRQTVNALPAGLTPHQALSHLGLSAHYGSNSKVLRGVPTPTPPRTVEPSPLL